ncbi:MAG: hypothetical protein HFH99_04160 [Lachnospiraceae bacterium]|nr:M56 family metallopeptidase [uncultured Acetatifactor sp.]MCI8695960.1 hypothetical protein [Lachnospiraceae bacterium]
MTVEEYSSEIIRLILSMTFTGSIISSLLFILKPIIKDRLPKSFQYYMWFSAVIGLMLPVSKILRIPVSDASIVPMKSMYDIVLRISDTASEKPVNLLFAPRQITCLPSAAAILYIFWQIGMVLALGFHILCYGFYIRKLGRHNLSANQQETELVKTPAVHWFNPLVHFVRREMNKACELACDESVIKRLDRKGMQQYGDTLIAVAADSIRKMPLSVTMFEDKKNLKERLGAIMKHKKYPKRTVITASIVLVTIVCVILGTSALHGTSRHDYMDNFSLQDQMQIREGKLKEAIRNYDKENNLAALVSINYLDSGEITNAYIYHKPWRKS